MIINKIMTMMNDDGLVMMLQNNLIDSASTSFTNSLQWLQHSHSVSPWIHSSIFTSTTSAPIPTSRTFKRIPSLPQLLSPNTHLLFSINPTVIPLNLRPLRLLLLLLQQRQQQQHRPRHSSTNRLEQVAF